MVVSVVHISFHPIIDRITLFAGREMSGRETMYKQCENCNHVQKAPRYATYQCNECGYFHNHVHPSQAA